MPFPPAASFSPRAGRRNQAGDALSLQSGERAGVRGVGDWPQAARPAPHPNPLPAGGERESSRPPLLPARRGQGRGEGRGGQNETSRFTPTLRAVATIDAQASSGSGTPVFARFARLRRSGSPGVMIV